MSPKAVAYAAEASSLPYHQFSRENKRRRRLRAVAGVAATVGLVCFAATHGLDSSYLGASRLAKFVPGCRQHNAISTSAPAIHHPYGIFPRPDDPLHFMPCTSSTVPPKIEDDDATASWARLYDPNPSKWSWGASRSSSLVDNNDGRDDEYAGRGVYLCGYIDVPRDWTNTSDSRITRVAITKYQVAGPGRPGASAKSERTIFIEPGGPGGSGTAYAWHGAEAISKRLSGGEFDVLGWDPRGVNTTQPAASCFPYNADRDRWWQLAHRYRAVSTADTAGQLQVADAYFESMFAGCENVLGDLGRFLGTGLVARDLDAIRAALGEPELTGYLMSYGTGIGQTYANMFPEHVGRMILDGTQFGPVEWSQAGFGWGSLDNVTHAYHDGFLGECIDAGPEHCPLARPLPGSTHVPTLPELEARMAALFASVAARPIVAYTALSGPSIVTYSALVASMYATLYNPHTWPGTATMLYELEQGNATLVSNMMDHFVWQYDPAKPVVVLPPTAGEGGGEGGEGGACPPALPVITSLGAPDTDELMPLVICADSYDAPQPADGLVWWDDLWANMTATSWIAGNSRFYNVLPCRHYAKHWPQPAGVFRGPLNASLANPVLLVAETYDPATPLANGRLLLAEMGHRNARLLVHHGYGHASYPDPSDCTEAMLLAYVRDGVVPDETETQCYANEKPYRYGIQASAASTASDRTADKKSDDHMAVWKENMQAMRLFNPGLARGRL
ncbi:hypothetical protein SBRCBS47491_003240 [Sporothrix bragantina]|uniref:AB hydrolase-1 domain-containing protein n=1 Tax=Sporothrix bragantina TaxID=671064 RepID=A0ABP0BDP0_9PEZI